MQFNTPLTLDSGSTIHDASGAHVPIAGMGEAAKIIVALANAQAQAASTDLAASIITHLQAAGYRIDHGDGYGTGKATPGMNWSLGSEAEKFDSAGCWFTWRAEGMAECEVGETFATEAEAWNDAMAHWFKNASVPIHFGAILPEAAPVDSAAIKARLEYLRGELRAERISYFELSELQGLAEHIDASDVELLEAAGVPEAAPAARMLDAEELATVLCALRCYQQVNGECGGDVPDDLEDIRSDGGKLEPLDMDEVDALCERLNLGGIATAPASLLSRCEAFIAGFEDDELQEGIPALLADLRQAIAGAPLFAPEAPTGHAALIDSLDAYCKAQGLPHMSADELAASEHVNDAQRAWLRAYVNDWDRWTEFRRELSEALPHLGQAEGWALFNDNTELSRDDEQDRFACDEDAEAYVRRMAAAGSPVHAYALELLAVGQAEEAAER